MLKSVGKALRIIADADKEKIALVFDGSTLSPNFKLESLKQIKEALNEIGSTRIGKFISDKQLSQSESQLINTQGFIEEIVGSDVDIHVTLNALNFLNTKGVEIIGIASTDPNLFPVFSRIKKEKKLLIITWKEYITPIIESSADFILQLDYLT